MTDITLESIKNIIESNFSSVVVNTITSIGGGWSNHAVLINDSLLFRISKQSNEDFSREIKLLQFLKNKLDVAIPEVSHVSENGKVYAYKLLTGKVVNPGAMNLNQQQEFANVWIKSALQIKNSLNDYNDIHIFPDNQHRIEMVKKVLKLEILNTQQTDFVASILGSYLELYDKSPKVPVHGDMGGGNWLHDTESGQYALIDWSDVCLAPQEFNLYRIAFELPGQIHQMIYEYKSVTGDKLDLQLVIACGVISDVSIMGEKINSESVIENKLSRLHVWMEMHNKSKLQTSKDIL